MEDLSHRERRQLEKTLVRVDVGVAICIGVQIHSPMCREEKPGPNDGAWVKRPKSPALGAKDGPEAMGSTGEEDYEK